MAEPARPGAAGDGAIAGQRDPTRNEPALGRAAASGAPLPWALHPVPDRITLEDGERVRKAMRGMVQGDIDEYYPEDLVTYATGHRKGVDAQGTGPGQQGSGPRA